MTTGNGGRTTATWIAILISAIGVTNTMTYAMVKLAYDNSEARWKKMEDVVNKIDAKIDAKMGEFKTELQFRVEKANDLHKNYDIRLDRIETKVGLR